MTQVGECTSSAVGPDEEKCDQAKISKPIGSYDVCNPKEAWQTKPCHHFDFQGVVSGSRGPYTLTSEGEICPASFSCKWELDEEAGTLSDDTSTAPTHTAPEDAGDGYMRLIGMKCGEDGGCWTQKKVKIYEDHLARDFENFGTGISCGDLNASDIGEWQFTRFGATIDMPKGWNCHGSTLHHFSGWGSGSVAGSTIGTLLNPVRLKMEVQVTHADTPGGGRHPPLGVLNRGDIVAYYTATGELAHTQTCTGVGSETYGANNKPVRFPGYPKVDEAWVWATSNAGDWANNIKKGLRLNAESATPFTIKVFSKL